MQQRGIAVYRFAQTQAPKRGRAPVAGACEKVRPAVGKSFPHVVQQQVGIGADDLVRQAREWRVGARLHFGNMAHGAAGLREELFAADDG